MQLLSENAIVHISAGFEGPFILQAFGIRRDLYRRGTYNFCVTDGTVYIGAKFECAQDIELDNYNFIQITAKFEDRSHPIIIKTLEVVSTAGRKLVGNPPCTLQDYFNRETRVNGYESQPSKRIKLNEEDYSVPRYKAQDIKTLLNEDNPKPKPEQRQERRPDLEKQKKPPINVQSSNQKRQLRFAEEQSEEEQSKKSPLQLPGVEDSKSVGKNSPIVEAYKGRSMEKTCEISDLYERSTGWVLLCRVNYMSIVECQNGLFAVNFIMCDECGNEMKCVYFVGDVQTARDTLTIGGYYLFSGGEVKLSQKDKQLQITFDRNSDIIAQSHVYFPTLPGRFKRIDGILSTEHGSVLDVLGVVRRIKSREQFKSKTRFTATLCDPLKHLEVDFMLFLNNEQREIAVGMLIVLHNFQVFKQQSIFRLNSTYKSYYFEERGRGTPGEVLYQMQQIIELTDWETEGYRNISMFAFTNRTIHDLREITSRTDDQRLYSALDVWALDVVRKKSYQACRNCKRPTEKKEMGLYECVHCKKIVETLITHALSVNFGDFTGSTNIDVIGEHAESLLIMKACEFNSLSPEEQTRHLQSLRYRNVILRLKSERKGDKKENHSVWGIDRALPETTLKEIRKRMQINRLKEEEDW